MVTSAPQWARQALFPRITFTHLAATLLLIASGMANFKYGMSLGQTALESWIAGLASIGADIWNAVGLIAVAWAAKGRQWGKAAAAGLVLACTLLYSVNAGIGFAASTKEETIGKRSAEIRADKAAEADLKRIEARLLEIGPQRPTGSIASEADAILADQKAEGCKTLNGAYTKKHCPRYFKLKSELALASERERLISDKTALSSKIQQTETVAVADPTGSTVVAYLAKLGVETTAEGVRPWQTLLFVVLVVVGGPVGFWIAEGRIECSRSGSIRHPGPANNENAPVRDHADKAAALFPVSENRLEPNVSEPLPPLAVVRQRKLAPVTPAGDAALKKLRASGGKVTGKSHAALATKLKIPRTSFRRVIDQLEASGLVSVGHGPDGYSVKLAA